MEPRKVQWSLALVIVLCAAVAMVIGKVLNPFTPWFFYIVLVGIGFFVHTIILIMKTDNEQKVTDTELKKRA